MDGAQAHARINRLLEHTQCGATTTEGKSYDVWTCHVKITWWPTRKQMLKFPKVMYETTRPNWDEAFADCEAWVWAELPEPIDDRRTP